MKLKAKNVKWIVIHCSDTPDSTKSRWYNMGFDVIDEWHKARFKPICNGDKFIYCGYHFIIKKDGTIEEGRPLEHMGQQAAGFNWRSIGICLIGRGDGKEINGKFIDGPNGIDDIATAAQKATLSRLIKDIQTRYSIPSTNIIGHHDTYPLRKRTMNKPCPGFSVSFWLTGKYKPWEEAHS